MLSIQKKTIGEFNPSYLSTLNNQAFLYSEMKDNPDFSEISTLKQIPLRISYLEVMQNIIKGGFGKSFLQLQTL